jgi:class 3 adenylate cyclase/tetratricopeptide (TPR) repeat protein
VIKCEACRHENPETNRFCGECAAPLAQAEPRSEVRKTVTIVFCDLVGSTAMGAALDPEQLRLVTQRYFDAMRVPIERHGGTVEKFIGDAVMAVFGVPQVHEDDALRAVRAAADMRKVLAALNTELDHDHGVRLECRIGVNTGGVVSGVGDSLIVGDAVNVAARLEQAAGPGEILLGEETYRLVRDAVSAEPVDALDLKGKAEPVPAHRLIDVTAGAAGFARHLDAPMVGRERELALLRSAFERTVSDQACQLFTVLGVGGVGKSRLMAAFVEEISDRATILRGRCLPYGEGITFYPLTEALVEIADLHEADTPDAARAKLAALAGSDGNAGRIAELVGQAIGIAGESAPEETFWAIRTLLEHLAADRPLVFAIDDLQWAEPKFLEFVEHVADFARDAPILLACMARPELLDEHAGWAGGKLNATSILIEPLGREECGKLVANLLADDTVDAAIRARPPDAAEGHPLYAEEMTGLLVDEGRLVLKEGRWVATSDLSDVPVPPTISALLAARLDKLPARERRLLDIASVMGQIFYPAAVRTLARDGADDVDLGIGTLVRQQVVRRERSDLPETEAMAFRHMLIREAAYDAVPKAARAELHEGFAGWLDATGGAVAEQDEIVGYHLEQAYRYRSELGAVGDRERQLADVAGRRLANAGEKAFSRGDHHASISLLSRASGLLALDDPLRLGLLSDLGSSLVWAGDPDGGRAALDEAVERAAAVSDDRMWMHASILRRMSLGEGDDAEARREAERALVVFEAAGDERGLSRAWRLLSTLGSEDGLADDEALARALVHARNADDVGEQTEIYWQVGFNLARGPTHAQEAIQRCKDILAETEGNRTLSAEMFHALGHLLARRGAFEEALGFASRCRDINRENGAMWAYWMRAEIPWDIKMLAGEPEEALEILAEGYEHTEQMGASLPITSAFLAQSLYALERFDEAEHRARVAVDAVDDDWARFTGLGVLARVLAQRGHLEEAERMAREAVTHFEGTKLSIERTTVLMDLAEVLRLAGRPDEVVLTLRTALELFEQKGDVVSAARARVLIDDLTNAGA